MSVLEKQAPKYVEHDWLSQNEGGVRHRVLLLYSFGKVRMVRGTIY